MLSREQLRLIAMDLSLAETGLQSLLAGTRDNSVLMERMIRAHGLAPDRMRRALVTLLRDCGASVFALQNHRKVSARTRCRYCCDALP
jgi:hypothetical protein